MTTSCKAETAASAHITCQVCVQPRWAHGLAAAPPLPGAGLCKLQCATGSPVGLGPQDPEKSTWPQGSDLVGLGWGEARDSLGHALTSSVLEGHPI